VLDQQQQTFVGGERLMAMTLGLAAIGERVASLLAIPARESVAANGDHPLALALLGVLSLRRTLWSALALQPSSPRAAAPLPSPEIDLGRLPEGLLR
jgi:hypothetical protein